MYHVIGTGLAATILYLISYFFCRAGYYTLKFHRKIWNIALAISFVLTAAAGLFLALQVSYKWDIPYIKQVLKIHVESGIGMAFTAIFHFIWHLSYFSKSTGINGNDKEAQSYSFYSAGKMKENLFIIGFSSSSVQLLLLREILNISGGYELISGLFLGSWLTGSALGARMASTSKLNDIRKINILYAISPLISITLMLTLARLFLTSGETPSFLVSIIYTLLILLPFAIVSGFTFVKLLLAARSEDALQPGNSFSIETAGGVVSGVLITLLTAGLLNTYQLLFTTIILSVTWVLLAYYIKTQRVKILIKSIAAILSAALVIFNADICFRQILLPGIKVTYTEDTPYGNITKGSYSGEISLYYNQRLLSYSNDVTEREENIHYAMLQSKAPESVIMISGSLASHYQEILKYPVNKVTFIEVDPLLAKTIQFPENKNQVKPKIIRQDAYSFMSRYGEPADVIILLVPPPSTMALNRYYSVEFFRSVRERLNQGGIFLCTPGPSETYYNPEELRLYSSVYNSLRSVFKNVIPVAGNKLYFIASDNELSTAFCRMVNEKGIINTWVNNDFLSDDLTASKTEEITALMDKDIKVNRVSSPVTSYHYQSLNLSRNRNEKAPALILMVLLFAIPAFAIKKRHTAMYFSASALAGFEVTILLTMQIIAGNIYHLTGLVIAGIMTGLAIGAANDFRFLKSSSLAFRMVLLLSFYAGFGAVFTLIAQMRNGLPSTIFIILAAIIPAVLTGNIFRQMTSGTGDPANPSLVYSADLAGSAAGFILVTGFIIPAFGIATTVFLLGVLVLAGIVFGTIGQT